MQTELEKPKTPMPADPIRILKDEHDKIELVLLGLEGIAKAAAVGAFTNTLLVRDVVWFLREYADAKHHAKEESLLFPVLELHGMDRVGGPTEVMRQEHIQGRKLAALLAELTSGDAPHLEPDWREVSTAALAYVSLLRVHISKENHCLFAIADDIFGPTEKDALASAFRRVDRQWNEVHGREGEDRVMRLLQAFRPTLESGDTHPEQPTDSGTAQLLAARTLAQANRQPLSETSGPGPEMDRTRQGKPPFCCGL